MSNAPTMRASDRDRQEIVDLLRGAVEDGRLKLDEYMDRMERAYQAVTFADLAPLCADLPARVSGAARSLPAARSRPTLAGLPAVLRVLWAIWFTAVFINVVVWLLVTATSGHLAYPWPLWVAGPYGAALFGISAAVSQLRRCRRPRRARRAHRHLPRPMN